MFTFLTPLFLVGLAAAAIPLLIHLSRSRRVKKMPFSTTRFFTDQFLRSYRMSRLKEIGLLLARMALFALLAMALAQPVVLPKSALFRQGRRSVVLVLDTSASMGYTRDGVRLIERASAAASQVLDNLAGGDRVGLVLAGCRAQGPEAVFPALTSERADVQRALDGVEPLDLATDLGGAVRRAEALLAGGGAEAKEIYVFSDLQASGWADVQAREEDAPSDISYFFVSVRSSEPQNIAVTAIQAGAARPVVGAPYALRPHIRVEGGQPRTVRASLFVDGKKVADTTLRDAQPGRWAAPLFLHRFESGGWHTGYVDVEDPLLEADNRRFFAFHVAESVPVLAVNGAPSRVPQADELFFLQAALTAGDGNRGPIDLAVVSPDAVPDLDPDRVRLVILANVARLAADAVSRLERYVDQGGGLLVFLGDRVEAKAYRALLGSAERLHGGLLPARLESVVGQPDGETLPVGIGFVRYEHPALSVFADADYAGLGNVGFRALWRLDADEGDVLMRTGSGDPLLVGRRYGRGRVLLFAAPCDRDWSDFPVKPVFLPWLHRVVLHLAQQAQLEHAYRRTGEVLQLPRPATGDAASTVIVRPDDRNAHPYLSADGRSLLYDAMDRAGVYSVEREQADGTVQREVFVANLDGLESSLEPLAAGEGKDGEQGLRDALAGVLPGRPFLNVITDPERVVEASLAARRGVKLWDLFLLAVLVLALLEPWIANRISLRHYVRPSTAPAGAAAGPGGGR